MATHRVYKRRAFVACQNCAPPYIHLVALQLDLKLLISNICSIHLFFLITFLERLKRGNGWGLWWIASLSRVS
ncbi:hypothetical protein VTN00DRAFT_6308 [Thermoascus crustaceus]|uniref:uncharacterized protein n=1 Tax=Thermoascus crustaceus TaxID=5088 RepID=UPI003742D4A2